MASWEITEVNGKSCWKKHTSKEMGIFDWHILACLSTRELISFFKKYDARNGLKFEIHFSIDDLLHRRGDLKREKTDR